MDIREQLSRVADLATFLNPAKVTGKILTNLKDQKFDPVGYVKNAFSSAKQSIQPPQLDMSRIKSTAQSYMDRFKTELPKIEPVKIANYIGENYDKFIDWYGNQNMMAPTGGQLPFTNKQAAQFLIQGPAQTVARTYLSAFSNNKQWTPSSAAQRYLFGDEPVKNWSGHIQDVSSGLQGVGINKGTSNFIAAPLAIGLGAVDFVPVGGTGKGKMAKIAATEGKVILEGLQGANRAWFTTNGLNALIQAGFPKKIAEAISTPQAAYIIKNKISPKQWIGTDALEAGARKFSQIVDDLPAGFNVKQKVNVLDYFRTPDRVLKKIGMEKEMNLLRDKYEDYITDLPLQIQRISDWKSRVFPESSQRIFKFLDGQKQDLLPQELEVADEMKATFKEWADKLKLPTDKRITNYITHIFSKDEAKEFDPDIAKLIRDKVAGSTYDPFVSQRLGKQGYIEDAFLAMEAYTKRATRKFHMDQALEQVAKTAEGLEDSQYKYVKNFIDRVNLRPTDLDNLVDNLIKSTPIGYKFGARPTAAITRNLRQWVYRGTLGLNPATALRNLSQGSNTYAKLGEKYTALGYAKVTEELPKFLSGAETELHRVGVLQNNFLEDKSVTAAKSLVEKLDPTLFYMFERAEMINRGAAYYGAKAKGLAKGMSEDEAIKYAKEIVRDTQFKFGSIDTPLVLASDLAKTGGQFMSYSVKQGEFFLEQIQKKEVAGLLRYAAATFVFAMTVGQVLGNNWWETAVPSLRFGVPPTMQAPYGAFQVATGQPDQYGNEADPNLLKRAWENDNLRKGLINYFPAGNQINKTIEGLQANAQSGSYTDSGNLQYPVESNSLAPIFGKNTLPQAQEYFDEGEPFSEKQTKAYKALIASGKTPEQAYDQINNQRVSDAKFKDSLASKKDSGFSIGNFVRSLFGGNEEESTEDVVYSDNPIIAAKQRAMQADKKDQQIKEIFELGLSTEETEQLLEESGLGSMEDASYSILKGFEIGTGERGEVLKEILTEKNAESNEAYLQEVNKLVDKDVLTKAVVTDWYERGVITPEEKTRFNKLIDDYKNDQAIGGGSGKKLKFGAVRKLRPKVPTLKTIRTHAPKIEIAISKPANFKPIQKLKYKNIIGGYK